MESALPFVALWSEVLRSTGEVVLHLLNRERHHTVPRPEIGTNAKSVEAFLPDLARAVPALDPHTRWLLLLEPSLPVSWLGLRWESLNLAGRPLSSQALVVRHAGWGQEQPASTTETAWLLNLFPAQEFSFLDRLQPQLQSGRLRTCRKNAVDRVSGADDLFLLAHGRANGLVDADDLPFTLPAIHPAPRRLWLLACNIDGALDGLAQEMLKCGCETVIAATSELSAPAMAALIDDWLSHGREFANLASWLALAKGHGDGNIHALTIWGRIGIDPTPCAHWNRLTWDDEHGDRRRPPLDDETSLLKFQDAHRHAVSSQAWPLTRKWMLPPLLWLAEKHHHPAMRELSEAIGDSDSPQAIRGLAAAARRVGNYVQTARYLSLGLNLPDLRVKERADYLGALANLFIDLNLPDSAARAIELHEDCNFDDPKDRNDADFKRLDWMARMQARCGRLDIALDLMTTKRKRANPDTGRELAWQLYLAAWGRMTNQITQEAASEFATEVRQKLKATCPQDVGFGNETIAYLLRALAVYVWATGDPESFGVVSFWLVEAEHRLADDDPGPWAYLVAYLHFQKGASLVSFDRSMNALVRARYHLEAATLMGIANRESDRRRLLERFQKRRMDTVLALKTGQISNSGESQIEAKFRNDKENDIPYNLATAARMGMLPL